VRLIIQRVKGASVSVEGETVGHIGPGLCLFLAVAKGDRKEDADYLAGKVSELRIFEDEGGKMNSSLKEVNGGALVVSEFTLYGDCTKGRRPSFSQAAPPHEAEGLCNYFVQRLEDSGLQVATGKFQAKMEVGIINDGPVTLILDSR
jgi:D-tyrosyl-tRNA(Tyr) deacylase